MSKDCTVPKQKAWLLLKTALLLSAGYSAPAMANTSGADPTLVNALSSVNTAPVVVQTVHSSTSEANGQNNLDDLKIIQARDGSSPFTYLGVYHRQVAGTSSPTNMGLAGSNDLRSWTIINPQLDTDNSSVPDITKLPDNSYLVVYENDPSAYDTSRPASPRFRMRHYVNYGQLAAGSADRQYDFGNTLSSTHCAEGTPSFRKISYNNSVDDSTVELGFHYCNYDGSGHLSGSTGVPDSVARGTLTNFRLWRTQDWTELNHAMRQSGVSQVGQMAHIQYQGNSYTLVEGQSTFGDFGSFKLYLYNEDSKYLQKLNVTTPGGSYSISNPRIGVHYNSSGNSDGIIGSYTALYASSSECNGKCAGTNEGGTLLFSQTLDSTLADGTANFTPFSFRYNPVFSICNNGCQGILLASRGDLSPGSGTSVDIGGISTSVGGGQRFIVYGSYISSLPPIPLYAVFRMQLDSVASGNDHVARLEVVDHTTGVILASRELYRRDFDHAYAYSDLSVPFNWSSSGGHQAEFRVATYDTSYMKVASVGLYLASYTFSCPGDLSIGSNAHSTGSSCISNSSSVSDNIVYGPYLFDFPGKISTASYSIRGSSLTATGGTAVATVDVNAYNSGSGQSVILARSNITASQLSGNYQTFALDYDPTYYVGNGWNIETRVSALGRGSIETQYTFVTPKP